MCYSEPCSNQFLQSPQHGQSVCKAVSGPSLVRSWQLSMSKHAPACSTMCPRKYICDWDAQAQLACALFPIWHRIGFDLLFCRLGVHPQTAEYHSHEVSVDRVSPEQCKPHGADPEPLESISLSSACVASLCLSFSPCSGWSLNHNP